MGRFARYCKECKTTVWLESPHAPCGTCGGLSADVQASVGVAIKCVHWDRLHDGEKGAKTGFHYGIGEYVTSWRDAQNKAARKGLTLERAYNPGRGLRVMG